jgi:hypothetical protein
VTSNAAAKGLPPICRFQARVQAAMAAAFLAAQTNDWDLNCNIVGHSIGMQYIKVIS